MNRITATPTGLNFFIYRASPLRTFLVDTRETGPEAQQLAIESSALDHTSWFSIVLNGNCIAEYKNGKRYSI